VPPDLLRWLVATIHLLALPLGLAGVWSRARSLRGPLDAGSVRRVFSADSVWAVAALLWIATGLWRAFGPLEKGMAYYLANPVFHAKMGLLLLVLLLEIWPMVVLIRWRTRLRKGWSIEGGRAATLARISEVQALLVVLMLFAATAMARGVSF
jgi:putative membrane protein